jgi:uncharacterized protein
METTSTPAPKRWKMALLTWACIYPLLNLLLWLLMPHIISWHPLLRTLMLTVILVPIMGIVLGALTKRFAGWLTR